mgnify:CR=1 FL=1
MDAILYIVVPCYNEEACIDHCARRLLEKLDELAQKGLCSPKSRLLFVNDGSSDTTRDRLAALRQKDGRVCFLSLSTNCGHQNALLAGMLYAKEYADCVITIDADLQQDVNAMDEFLRCYAEGVDIVFGVRRSRDTDGFLKRVTAQAFYGLMHAMGANVIRNHADYRLLSRRALDALAEYQEVNLFLRGLIPTMGFASDVVYFDVKEREAGGSKYTFSKMMKLAIDGITSMSIRPIRLITVMGFLVCLFSIGMIIYCIYDWTQGRNVPGYTTTLVVSLLMGGLTLFSLGIVGEYVGKIYLEAKARPRYIVQSFIWKDQNVTEKNEYSEK